MPLPDSNPRRQIAAVGAAALAALLAAAGCRTPADRPGTGDPPATAQPTLALDLGGSVQLTLVRVPAGEFLMGAPPSEFGRQAREGPQHTVRFARPYYIGAHEVTQAQWQAVMGENPAWRKGQGLELPVEHVSWADCNRFCEALSRRVGRTVRLPTEAEWEYACRAGTTGAYSFGDDAAALGEYAWFRDNAGGRPWVVGTRRPNPWGLYDMHGNVWEWCADPWQPDYEGAPEDGRAWESGRADRTLRVLRGGSWFEPAERCRSACRYRRTAALRGAYVGLRVVVESE